MISCPGSVRSQRRIAILPWALAIPGSDRSAAAQSYCWNAGDVSRAEGAAGELTTIGNLTALRFDSAKQTSIDLTSEYSWHDLGGPVTIRVVFRPTRIPREKTPLISKWHMTAGGRSFELGLLSDGRPFFDISGSGNWDQRGRELVSFARALPEQPYCLAAVFDPGTGMSLFMNGKGCGALREDIPQRLHACDTPVLLGAQPPGLRWADVDIAQVLVDRRPLTAGRDQPVGCVR